MQRRPFPADFRYHRILPGEGILAPRGFLPLLPLVFLVLACAAPRAGADPRISLVELQISRNHTEALRYIERALAEEPERARQLGLDYLRGHLLLGQDRRQEALEAFATAMSSTPQLGAYSRYQLALEQERRGHPEVAAGLVATLLRSDPPKSLVGPAVRLLRRTVDLGGDCRVLRGLEALPLRSSNRRELTLAVAECRVREKQDPEAERLWLRLLEDEQADPAARVAAEKLAALKPAKKKARSHMLIGLAFYRHREFDVAVHHLARALVQLPTASDISARELYELRYALARSHFWEGRYRPAATAFGDLAADTTHPSRKARSLYQEARCYELSGRWEEAVDRFRLAFATEPGGGWADSALIAELRLKWRRGDETGALASLDELLKRRQFGTASRALLFLASSDIVARRDARAHGWLRQAAQLRRVGKREIHYWQGRLAELRGQHAEAVGHYLGTLREDPYHPLAQAAREHLRGAQLERVALSLARDLTGSKDPEELYRAWLLLPESNPLRAKVRQELERGLTTDRAATTFLRLSVRPASDWPLWSSSLDRPEEMLLALGLFREGGSKVLRYFPVAQPELAFTGSLALARTGDTRRSLYIAEILSQRVPRALPTPLLPEAFRQLLYPSTYQELIRRESERQGIDAHLLAAIIREESRFDPRAFSTASARGLTQFVFPTARLVASQNELGPLAPQDLERPEVAIALGAAYLRQLSSALEGSLPEVISAYNAGEPQAELWRRYCLSDEPAEYLTKVAFRETRKYLTRVLTSRAHYRELYPRPMTIAAHD